MTQDYVSFFINTAFAQNDFLPFLSLMFLFFGRMLPIIALVPFFGEKVLPRPVKVTFAFSLFIIFLPQLLAATKTPLGFNMQLLLFMSKELFIGLLMGFFLSIPFMIVQSAGILIDHQRGGSSLMINDPTMQNQSSPLGTLFNYILIILFFLIDGPFTVLEIIGTSYQMIPPDRMLNMAVFSANSQLLDYAIKIVGQVMILGTQLAAPALIIILMTDFFLGIANRLAPQVQITFLGMPLKSLLGLTIVFFGWTLFNEEMVAQAYKALQFIGNLIKQMTPS